MPYREASFGPGGYYHIYNRGAGRQKLFFNAGNYEHCLRLTKKYLPRFQMTVIAYCLMPNHYHFLLRQEGDVPISRFINTLFNAYVQAVNRQQERTDTLFEGRFKHVRVDRQEYLLHVSRYIHAYPVKAALVAAPEAWPYSNYLEWLGSRPGTLVDHDFVASYYSNRADYSEFVWDYLRGHERPPEELKPYLLAS